MNFAQSLVNSGDIADPKGYSDGVKTFWCEWQSFGISRYPLPVDRDRALWLHDAAFHCPLFSDAEHVFIDVRHSDGRARYSRIKLPQFVSTAERYITCATS